MAVKVGIIGSAGRNEDGAKMSKEIFDAMCVKTKSVLHELGLNMEVVHFVSGGSAWSDHVAVRLFVDSIAARARSLVDDHTSAETISDGPSGSRFDFPRPGSDETFGGLTLHLPCAFVPPSLSLTTTTASASMTIPGGKFSTSPSCGRTLNKLHTEFSDCCEFDSLAEISTASRLGADLQNHNKGFFDRNLFIARDVEVLIAFSWREHEPTRDQAGGTAHTWNHATSAAIKIHVPISSLASR